MKNEQQKASILRHILIWIVKMFSKRTWELKHRAEIRRELKRKSKNELIRMILALRKQAAIDGQRERKKALKQMNKNHKTRLKVIQQGRTGNE